MIASQTAVIHIHCALGQVLLPPPLSFMVLLCTIPFFVLLKVSLHSFTLPFSFPWVWPGFGMFSSAEETWPGVFLSDVEKDCNLENTVFINHHDRCSVHR